MGQFIRIIDKKKSRKKQSPRGKQMKIKKQKMLKGVEKWEYKKKRKYLDEKSH